jgi:cell division protein FtsW
VGVVMVYSASKYSAQVNYGNKYFYMTKQLIGAVLGLGGMIGTSLINHKIYQKFYLVAYGIGMVLLALLFIPGLAKTSYGATRWIGFGSFTMKPVSQLLFTTPESLRTFVSPSKLSIYCAVTVVSPLPGTG